ncbi:protein kinase domain-containing protein [Myxococcus sp. Y35]|uniref:serine/threonine-protein kinase n=1 Tax=Pseudomyxococcus flavus TaxID=3115648 RepID=UPI003CF79117
MEHPIPERIGPYRLLHLIGSGGMGHVYAAVHEHLGQRVALKLLSSAAAKDPHLVARFLQEGRALAGLDHPGVVRVFHCEPHGGDVFLAMELLQGVSLREWMQRPTGPVSQSSVLAIAEQIARIMVDVHARGIVHRDLKPENVFLCPDAAVAPGYRVKLLDFGIAKVPTFVDGLRATTQVHTHESSFMGTYLYMAPEQLLSAATVDGAADVYSLGVMLFEMLAGRPPFVSDEPREVLLAHQSDEPPSLRSLAPQVPASLSAFIASMLAKDTQARPTMARCAELLGQPWEGGPERCPVPGLAPFVEEQAALFFGREAETRTLLSLLDSAREGPLRWIQLEGPSGVGKSSLIQAGVLPRLREAGRAGGPQWRVINLRPSSSPLRALAEVLATAYPSSEPGRQPEALEALLRMGPGALLDFLRAHTSADWRVLLVVEPLEELFTLGFSEQGALDALVAQALVGQGSPLRLFTSVRSDFLHRMEQLPELSRHLHAASRFPLLPMDEAALERVVKGVARNTGLRLEPGLASRLVQDARDEGGRLPLLGQALRALWVLNEGAPLTQAHYERLGGVGGALAQQAEALLDGLGPQGRERAKWLLLDLVQVGRGVPDTRRPRSREEVIAAAGGDALAEEVLLRLTGMRTQASSGMEQGMRLVTLSEGAGPTAQRVDLVHETLLHRVPSLVSWLEQERALLERHADLEAAASAWEQARCPNEGLPTGTLLTHYRGGVAALGGGGGVSHRASSRALRFLDAAARLEQRRSRARRVSVCSAAVAVLLILFYAVRTDQEWRRAESERLRAENARNIAARQRHRADENRRQLIKSVDAVVGVLDWKLSRLPGTLEDRKRLLGELDEGLKALPLPEHQDADMRLVDIRMAHRLADVAYHDGTLAGAERRLKEALADIRMGHLLEPGGSRFHEFLGLNYSKQGKVEMARGQWEKARALFTESIALLEHWPSNPGTWVDHLRSLAVSISELAELELAAGDLPLAAQHFDRARALHAYIAKKSSYSSALQALVLAHRAEVALASGDLDAAEPLLVEALTLGRACVESQEVDQYYRWVLGRVLIGVGDLRTSRLQFSLAEKAYAEARGLGQALREAEPPNKRYALVLADAWLGSALLARQRGALEQAADWHARRCALLQFFHAHDPEDVRFQPLGCPDVTR